eukprot:13744924-Ditylum_brightwellii.AAC.1
MDHNHHQMEPDDDRVLALIGVASPAEKDIPWNHACFMDYEQHQTSNHHTSFQLRSDIMAV